MVCTGEKNAVCTKATTRSAVLLLWLTLYALSVVSCCSITLSFVCSAVVGKFTFQRFVLLMHLPLRIILLLCVMVTVLSVNVVMHYASNNCPTNSSNVVPRAGKIWAVQAA